MTPSAAPDRPCRFRILVDRPDRLRPEGATGESSRLGHVFCQLADAAGNTRTAGYYARCYLDPQTHEPPEDRIRGLQDAFHKVRGFVKDDSTRRYDDEALWSISQEQHDRIAAFIERWKADPPPYSLATNNCSSFVFRATESGGLKPPPHLVGMDLPVAVSAWIQVGHAWEALRERARHAAERIAETFRGDPPPQPPDAFAPAANVRRTMSA